MKIKFVSLFVVLLTYHLPLISENCHIISPYEYQKSAFETKKSVFLAGSAALPWRENFKNKMQDDHVIFFDPMNSNAELISRSKTLKWEIDHIDKADVIIAWIPEGEPASTRTWSLTTLFELGRFVEMKRKPLIVGISPKHYMFAELLNQFKVLRPDAQVVSSLDEVIDRLRFYLENSRE
ncbi:MAG: nucleoside 2-deoxyribosyltransferase domain-containing protein [Chlamydiota bacterium]|nr:nucleoside 2-deoxyribosyltransferase domain-containing protein [Chlamydiota bacterium]